MPRYRFVLHECSGSTVRDSECQEFADLDAAKQASLDKARAVMAGEIERGRLCLSCWIVILNDKDDYLYTLHFGEAIKIVQPSSCAHDKAEARPSL